MQRGLSATAEHLVKLCMFLLTVACKWPYPPFVTLILNKNKYEARSAPSCQITTKSDNPQLAYRSSHPRLVKRSVGKL